MPMAAPSLPSRLEHIRLMISNLHSHCMDSPRRPYRGIKRQLVQAALASDPKGLVEYITATQDLDMSLITLFLPLLHANLIPRLPITSEGRQNAVAAQGAIMVISTQSTLILSRRIAPFPSEAVAQLLAAHCHELLRWFHFFLGPWTRIVANTVQKPFLIVIAYFLRTMVDTDDALTEIVMSEPVGIKTVLQLWTKKIDNDQYLTGDGTECCIIVDLLERVVMHARGQDCLLIMQHTNRRKVAQIFTTIRKRVQELSNLHATVSSRSSRLEDLLRLARLLRSPSCQLPRYLMRPLYSPNFIFDLCDTLDAITNGRKFPVAVATRCVSAIFEITLGDHGVAPNPVRYVKEAVDGGLCSILARALSYLRPSEETYGVLLRILDDLAVYAIYPDVLRLLLPATRWEADLHDRHSEGLKAYLKGVTTWVEERSHLDKDGQGKRREEDSMCYYLEHQDSCSVDRVSKSKRCSKCKAVVYCSSCCQMLDWNAGHRQECAKRRACVDQALSLQAQVALSTFVARFLSYKGRLEEIKSRYGPETLPDLFVTVFDARALPFDITFLSAVGLKDEASLFDQQGSKVVTGYLAELGGDPSVHLVDAWFPWGRCTINMLVRLRRLGGNDFRALSATVVGILPNEGVALMGKGAGVAAELAV